MWPVAAVLDRTGLEHVKERAVRKGFHGVGSPWYPFFWDSFVGVSQEGGEVECYQCLGVVNGLEASAVTSPPRGTSHLEQSFP